MVKFQITCPQRDCLGDSLGYHSELQATQPAERHAYTVMRVKAFGLHHVFTDDRVSTRVCFWTGLLLRLQLRARRRWKEPYLSIGKHPIYVKQQYLDFFGSFFR